MTERRCPDCEAPGGQLHELFCTKERCPFCGGQLVTCRCIVKVLQLTPTELDALDEYIDDTVDPLRSINERWVAAVEAKGRVPFGPPAE